MRPSLTWISGISLTLLSAACVTERVVYREVGPRPYAPPRAVEPAPPQSVVSVYIDAPIGQPEPIGCPWAPPPMLVEAPGYPPFEGAIWTGGYWVWHGTWVWDHGRWAAPPRPAYLWHPPYYENRDGMVVFITGHWGPPNAIFVPPPPSLRISVELAAPGVIPGPRPLGPPGVFVPPPPGSRAGIIVPAPMGTAPAVVTSAPPVVNVGMRITNNVNNGTINHTTNITNNRTMVVNNVTNVTNVTIVAPPSATASGQAVNRSVPAQAHLAAALPPVVRASAPVPATARPLPAYTRGQARVDLPAPQVVPSAPRPIMPPATSASRPAPASVPPPAPRPTPAPVQASAAPRTVPDHAAPPPSPRERYDFRPARPIQAPKQEEAAPPHPGPARPLPEDRKVKGRPKPTRPARPAPKDEKEARKKDRDRD